MDLMSGVGGPRRDTRGHVFGARALRARETVETPEDLLDLAQAALDDFRENTYSEDFGFIDDYVHVEDDVLASRLLAEVFADLLSGGDNVDVFVPDDLTAIDDDQQIQYILFPNEQARGATRTTLTADLIRQKVHGSDEASLGWTLRFLDANHEPVADATILECLAAELETNDGHFLLSDGTFFRVHPVFLDRIDRQLEEVQLSSLPLPCYRGGREGHWNRSVAAEQSDEFVCLDGDLIQLSGESPFEAADLVHVSGALVHAKRKGRSAALSYVFTQARRSCQLLAQVPVAAELVREKVAAAAASDEVGSHVVTALAALDKRPADLPVVIALLGDWQDRTVMNLPLLAKLELVETMRQIAQAGFNPSVALVDLCGRN